MDWLTMAERIGFPATVALILLFCFIRAGKWLGSTIVVPLAQAHLFLVHTLAANSKDNSESARRMAEGQEVIANGQKALVKTQSEIKTAIEVQTIELKSCLTHIEGQTCPTTG